MELSVVEAVRMKMNPQDLLKIKAALKEDIEKGDITSGLLVPTRVQTRALILAREAGIFCGGPVARAVFKAADPKMKVALLAEEGRRIKKDQKVIRIQGPARSILKAERTALNFLGHLSGIATRTAGFVNKIRKFRVEIFDTRKTTPLWRNFEKYAVQTGGGKNHRMGLYDAVFVKENHRRYGNLKKLKACAGNFEIEVRNMKELAQALKLRPKIILLDNFKPSSVRMAVKQVRKANPKIILEASGGINESNVAAYAATGVDRISIGALTHSVTCLDFSLLIE